VQLKVSKKRRFIRQKDISVVLKFDKLLLPIIFTKDRLEDIENKEVITLFDVEKLVTLLK